MLKTLFLGTPALAVPYLQLVAEQTQLLGVVTTPDEPAGRGYALKPSPVKETALTLKVPVFQPVSLKDHSKVSEDLLSFLQTFQPDVGIVVAYGKILPKWFLDIPRLGFLNVHFSLLPAYRGAAPIQHALMNGDTESGVTLFWLDEGMDTGPIFIQKKISVDVSEDAEALRQKLIPLGVEALKEALQRMERDDIQRQPQVGPASLAPMLCKEEGKLDWQQSASVLRNILRGTTPWPGAYVLLKKDGRDMRLKILKAEVVSHIAGAETLPSGAVAELEKGRGFVIKCGQEFLKILEVQPEGKPRMSAWAYWQGARLKAGDLLG